MYGPLADSGNRDVAQAPELHTFKAFARWGLQGCFILGLRPHECTGLMLPTSSNMRQSPCDLELRTKGRSRKPTGAQKVRAVHTAQGVRLGSTGMTRSSRQRATSMVAVQFGPKRGAMDTVKGLKGLEERVV
ncbi:unnamed protein product [Symbiodinium natans]|uniref:Uncharacterized protein n=1 Tax=Symbiodinium natans TaxID=878477 RepID=A0A812G1T4_9DINO|nr:unnamed protein product [Symbiodinium natans]